MYKYLSVFQFRQEVGGEKSKIVTNPSENVTLEMQNDKQVQF